MVKKKNIIIFLLYISLTSTLFAQLANSPSPKFHINNQNTGLSTYGVTPSQSINTIKIKTNWKVQAGGAIDSSAAIGSDGKIYVGGFGDNYIYCFNPTNGKTNWKTLTGWVVDSSPAIDNNGRVYIGSWDHTFLLF